MVLKDLLQDMDYKLLRGSLDQEIKDVVFDSRKAAPGTIFVAINGFRTDSHDFLPQTVLQGVSAVSVEKPWEALPPACREQLEARDVTVIQVENGRAALALLSAAFFGHPTRQLKVIGITGTKGKTTTTAMLTAILEQAGHKTGQIGTNGIHTGSRKLEAHNTTPEPYDTQRYAREMVENGCEYLVMEVSSTGIKYHRADGIDFDLGIFTNLSPDHIGSLEHPDFADYLENKAKLFSLCPRGLFNRDDPQVGEFLARARCEIHSFGLGPAKEPLGPDYAALAWEPQRRGPVLGTRLQLGGAEDFECFIGMPGEFNVYNALGALGAARMLGIPREAICAALESISVEARVEVLYNEDFTVVLDYAHNGVSATALLSMLRTYNPRQLTVIFGAEGGRAQVRRQEMGEVCGQLADFCILSSQNPDYEPIENIFRDIHQALDPSGTPSVDIADRREAIYYALSHAEKGDIIAVIGKGQENYELVAGVRHPHSDREEILRALKQLGKVE